jgi:hypothetical protein
LGKKSISVLVPVVLGVFLILANGCGAYNPNGTGTGTGTGTGSDPGAAKGFYECTLQQVFPNMEALILPTDVFYGVLGTLNQSSFVTSALVTGQGASGTTTYEGNFTEYEGSGSTSSSTVTATDVPNESMSGTITQSGVQVGFGGAFLPSSSYVYTNPASLTTIAGVWTGTLLDTTPLTITINSNGSITASSTSGCQVSGTVTTFTNNTVNVFSVTNLQFGASCGSVSNELATTAVAVVFLLPDGTPQLFMPATFGTTAATVFSAQP